MKRICKHCSNTCKKSVPTECIDYKVETRQDLVNERNKLLVSGDNPERLKIVTNKINYIDYGIQDK